MAQIETNIEMCIRDSDVGGLHLNVCVASGLTNCDAVLKAVQSGEKHYDFICLLYTSGIIRELRQRGIQQAAEFQRCIHGFKEMCIRDSYSPALAEQGRFSHGYILGLYRVLQSSVEQNPDVLFEGCSSGGNRFDLGLSLIHI